jgi:hypothetical protein
MWKILTTLLILFTTITHSAKLLIVSIRSLLIDVKVAQKDETNVEYK